MTPTTMAVMAATAAGGMEQPGDHEDDQKAGRSENKLQIAQ